MFFGFTSSLLILIKLQPLKKQVNAPWRSTWSVLLIYIVQTWRVKHGIFHSNFYLTIKKAISCSIYNFVNSSWLLKNLKKQFIKLKPLCSSLRSPNCFKQLLVLPSYAGNSILRSTCILQSWINLVLIQVGLILKFTLVSSRFTDCTLFTLSWKALHLPVAEWQSLKYHLYHFPNLIKIVIIVSFHKKSLN